MAPFRLLLINVVSSAYNNFFIVNGTAFLFNSLQLEKHVWWPELHDDVSNFIGNCLCCEKVRDGETIPRPFGETLQPRKGTDGGRNDILSFDFMYIEAPKKDAPHSYKYVLVLKDAYSGFVELVPCTSCNHEVVVEAIAFWCARYGRPRYLRSDQGSHFKNKVLEDLAKRADIHHHFTLPYCPWSNGSVEIVNRSIKKVLRTAILEQNLQTSDWPYLLPMVMNVINGGISRRLGNYCPRQVYMGLPGFDPFTIIYNPTWDGLKEISLDSNDIKSAFEELQEDLDLMHRKVDVAHARRRAASYKAFKKKLHIPDTDDEQNLVPEIDFCVGDFVLCAIPNKKKLSKLQTVWRGPYKVIGLVPSNIDASLKQNRVYELEHLVTHTKIQAHAMRIKFYADKDLDKYVDLDLLNNHISSQERTVFELESIVSHKYDSTTMQMMVECKWQGFTSAENTLEPVSDIFEDAPKLIDAYLKTLNRKAMLEFKKHLFSRT